jgi:hypothetical protein
MRTGLGTTMRPSAREFFAGVVCGFRGEIDQWLLSHLKSNVVFLAPSRTRVAETFICDPPFVFVLLFLDSILPTLQDLSFGP